MQLQAGMDAPQFQLADADMEIYNLAFQRGKKNVVLYFYPKDDTPGCTIEANEFSALDDDFACAVQSGRRIHVGRTTRTAALHRPATQGW